MLNNDISKELHTNFIEYAVAVNTDRAIPDSRDGLKPVAKRILWAATDMTKCTSSKPHVKSAKLVGDVMGTYHPHGDSSIYGALVRLSQNWVMRYPLIDFHGNNGNVIGDGPAHMRYTECRLSKLSEDGMLDNIKKESVDFIPNYDETTVEPVSLPSIFPNLLCNPNTGIGVAMACNWAPHNLNEVAQAIFDYMDGKEPTLPGPDFPTGGLIINKDDIPGIMATGHGSVKIRGKYNVEKQKIIFYEIPYGTTVEALIAEIGKASDDKEIEGISDVRDESNKKGLRIVIECDKNINPASVIKQLFAKTELQTSFSYNQVALVDKTPTELNLKDCIKIYIEYNLNCIERETKFDLSKAEARAEIVDGLLKALEDIDNIIALIKKSESAAAAKSTLMTKYGFTENQAKSILAMRLSSLARLEKVEIENEKAELIKKITDFKDIIGNKDRRQQILRERLSKIVKTYGDARRTELTQIDVKPEEKEIAEVIPEDVIVVVTQNGDIKRIPKTAFKTQRKNGKGVKTIDEAVFETISTNTIDTLMVFTNKGKMYRLVVDKIPVGTNSSKGQLLGTLINMDADEHIAAVTSLHRQTNAEYVLFFTKQGLVKKTKLEEYINTKKATGIQAIKIKDGDEIANVTFVKDEELLVVTKHGYAIHFTSSDIAPIGRVAAGVKSIKLELEDEVIVGLPINPNTHKDLAIFSKNGLSKKTSISEYPVQGRAGRGILTYKPNAQTGEVVAAVLVNDNNNLLLSGTPSSICISASDIPELSRVGAGNIMIKNSKINKVVKL